MNKAINKIGRIFVYTFLCFVFLCCIVNGYDLVNNYYDSTVQKGYYLGVQKGYEIGRNEVNMCEEVLKQNIMNSPIQIEAVDII